MAQRSVFLDGRTLTLNDVVDVSAGRARVEVDGDVRQRLAKARSSGPAGLRPSSPMRWARISAARLAEVRWDSGSAGFPPGPAGQVRMTAGDGWERLPCPETRRPTLPCAVSSDSNPSSRPRYQRSATR